MFVPLLAGVAAGMRGSWNGSDVAVRAYYVALIAHAGASDFPVRRYRCRSRISASY